MEVLTPLVTAGLLALVANRLTEGLVTPVFEKLSWDRFWLQYVAWLVGGLLLFLADVNLMADYGLEGTVGIVVSALVAGGGANLLHDIFKK